MLPILSLKVSKFFLTFIFLFFISMWMVIDYHIYHKSRFVNSANWLTGNVFSLKSAITDYFRLDEYNQILLWENKYLRNRVFNESPQVIFAGGVLPDSLIKFKFKSARVVKNSYSKADNYLTINKGSRQDIGVDMGVVSPMGVVGIVQGVSQNFASVQSILNTNSRINGGIKGYNTFGTLIWRGEDYNEITLQDIPRTIAVKVGDTVITSGMSYVFPKGLLIGKVEAVNTHDFDNYYTIIVKLFTDMTQLGPVYVIKNSDKEEVETLENKIEDAQ